MPGPRYIHIPPDRIAEGRRRYEETNEHNEDIAAFLGIGPSTFKSRRRQWGWRPRLTHGFKPPTPAPETTAAEQAVYQSILKDAVTEAERIRRTVECELAAIAHIVAKLQPGSAHLGEVERSARVLASLTRTLQEVLRLTTPSAPSDESSNDRGPDDPDAFADELVRRINEFTRSRQALVHPEPAADGS